MDIEKISESMVETILTDDNSVNLITDISDFSIDQIMEGPFKEIPFIKYIIEIAKFGISVRDSFLIHKIITFLKGTKKIDKAKKEKFKKKLLNDKKYSKMISDNLMVILDRLDHLTKAEYLAKLFIAHIDEKISYTEFLRLSNSIERAFIDDLNNLYKYYNKNLEEVDEIVLQNLYQAGLLGIYFNKIVTSAVDYPPQQTATYVRNDLGLLLCNIIFLTEDEQKIIMPLLNNLDNKLLEKICIWESENNDFFYFGNLQEEMKKDYGLTDEKLRFVFNNFERLNLIEKIEINAFGNYMSFRTNHLGYSFYFNRQSDKNDFIRSIIKSLLEKKINESSSFAEKNKISKRKLEYFLLELGNKNIITLQPHSNGYLIANINNQELNNFLSNIK